MTNRQFMRWRVTAQSMWKKSVASMVAACACRNLRQFMSVRRFGPGCDQPVGPQPGWQEPDQGGEDRAVGPVQPGPRTGTAQYRDLMPQHQQLNVLGDWRAAKQDKPAAEPDQDEIQQTKGHGRSSSPTADVDAGASLQLGGQADFWHPAGCPGRPAPAPAAPWYLTAARRRPARDGPAGRCRLCSWPPARSPPPWTPAPHRGRSAGTSRARASAEPSAAVSPAWSASLRSSTAPA